VHWLLLAAAGPLQGHRATTHWAYHRFLNRLGATYVPQRWVQDARYLTGAGVSAGIDTALQLAATLTNDEVARMVQLAIEYDPHPPHGGIDGSTVDRDSFASRVEGFAHQALEHEAHDHHPGGQGEHGGGHHGDEVGAAAEHGGHGHHDEMAPQTGHTDHGHEGHGPGTAGGIEWEDDMVAVNRLTTTANMVWKFVDRSPGATGTPINWQFRVGDSVKIRLVNEMDSDHPMHHPFHLHGAGRFLVLARDGVTEPNLVWKDTVLVRTGQTVDILFDVTNPGLWMAHCHIAEHMQSGMMFSFTVTRQNGAV